MGKRGWCRPAGERIGGGPSGRGGDGIPRGRRGILVIGITGGIGSGKGLAAEFFRTRGAAIIDADEVARRLTRRGAELVSRIAEEFGPEFVGKSGTLKRRKLAKFVFADPRAAARLNALTHPAIGAEIERMIEALARDRTPMICLVAPLLLEAGYDTRGTVDRVLLMSAGEKERIRRVMQRDGLTEQEVRQRIARQMPVEKQRRRADWVVDTTGGRAQARRQLEAIWAELTGS